MTIIKIKDNDEYFKNMKGCTSCPFETYDDCDGYAECYCNLIVGNNNYIGCTYGDEEYEKHREKRLEHCPIVSISIEN